MTSEGAKENAGGLAYEVILKPASNDGPRPPSPPREKNLTIEDISKKLQEAEERRQSLEAMKLDQIAKDRQRAQEALILKQQEEENFARATQEKLRRSMEINKENREAQIKALQDRLRDHEKKIEEVRKNKDSLKDAGEEQSC
ncbi:hypothetical protein ACJMK2_041740 [Sinanodonta woodiana]|uniref:Stathmin n=1 Tax=Sinanodonta woodiana TaxID=1069815 RepID=A0ABD3W8D0_SINWO